MPEWLVSNLATILISAVLLAAVARVILGMIRDKKRGKSSSGCGCSGCAASGFCDPGAQKKTDCRETCCHEAHSGMGDAHRGK